MYIRGFYFVMGCFLSFIFTLKFVEPIQERSEITIVQIQSLQSCYFSAVKLGKVDHKKASEFCLNHQEQTVRNFTDISSQMNSYYDNKYTYFYSVKNILQQ